MLKKTLLTAAAAVAITTGASALQATPAEAGYYGYGFKKHYGYGYGCYKKWRKIKIRYWSHYYYGWRYKYVWRPYKFCY